MAFMTVDTKDSAAGVAPAQWDQFYLSAQCRARSEQHSPFKLILERPSQHVRKTHEDLGGFFCVLSMTFCKAADIDTAEALQCPGPVQVSVWDSDENA